ncbi:MAG: helicase SNF2 [Candidatus Amoebophilus sp. 36-38]|nr:MAG: helicase SNF2 [Candidatus Amoebophilus sp. 36-38]
MKYGKTWWGAKWLETFNGIDNENRLPRGRSYANSGRAYDIEINENEATAKVQGSRPRPYKVSIKLNKFDETEQQIIHQAIINTPSILSALLTKKLPIQLLDKLNEHDIRLFPKNWSYVEAECSCPDWAVPCKHIAAVIYLIAAEIDKNPFLVFEIHGCNLLAMISDFGNIKAKQVKSLLTLEDIFKHFDGPSNPFDQVILEEINLSAIPDFSDRIITLLTNKPLFYEKNFREILHLAYNNWQKNPSGKFEEYTHHVPQVTKKDGKVSKKDEPALTEEEIFSKKWNNPERWNTFELVLDEEHQLIQVCDGNNILFPNTDNLKVQLTKFLLDIPNVLLHKFTPELRLMHMIAQFGRKLMQASAFMPQILQNGQGKTLIRWVPALLDNEINTIYKKLVSICPSKLVTYKKTCISPEEQIKTAITVILSGYMHNNLPKSIDPHLPYEVVKLFFENKACTFKDFSDKEIPGVINQWLSNLYLSERPHKLYLMIEDNGIDFELTIKIALDDKSTPIDFHEAISKYDNPTKLTILSDLALLIEYIPELSRLVDEEDKLALNLDDFAPLFLNILPLLKTLGIIIVLPKSLQKILKPQLSLKLSSKNKISDDRKSFMSLDQLTKFNWRIAIGDKTLDIAEFRKLVEQQSGLVRIMDEYVLLNEKEMADLLKKLDKLPDHLSQAALMQAALAGELDGATVAIDNQLERLFSQLGNYTKVSVPHNLIAQLRPYQERGFSWLVQNIETNFGSILADDMGLGKTLQVIATILYFKNVGFLANNGVLIVAPTTLLSNWQREVERFAPDLKLLVYHGQKRELNRDCDIVITSYGLARRDTKLFNKIDWFLLVIDEAQQIKNPATEQTKAIKSIKAQHKIAMSGTPVENRLLEYWSIFDFTNTHYLGTLTHFKKQFASPIETERDKDCLQQFKKVTSPFILRRLKSDKSIIQDLPDKIENNRYCSLTAEQTAMYQEVVDATMEKIEASEGIERRGLVLKLINALKQVCNHPSQFYKKSKAQIDQSGKMQMLEEILEGIEASGEKSLIFTQYTEMGNLIVKLLEERFKMSIPFLHGKLVLKARDKIVADFQNCSQVRTLIVSLKAGGTGLNLTAANNVIHYDLWWNPAVEAQATDRAYRIGQKSNVMVYRLLTTGTFEERIDQMIQSKKELAELTVGSGESWITELSNAELKDLIRVR